MSAALPHPVPVSSPSWTVGWGFSARCDLACPFCYSRRVRHDAHPDVAIDEARAFLARNRAQIRAINFGTGESFLAPSFAAVLTLCRELVPHALIAVTTNGALAEATPQVRELARQTIDECDVSIDFANASAHDAWRGKAGSWDRARRALRTSIALGWQTSMVLVGTERTLQPDNLRGLLAIAGEERVALRINLYMPTAGDRSFIPSPRTVHAATAALAGWGSALRSSDRLLRHLGAAGAGAAPHSCRILTDGAVTPSTYLLDSPWQSPAHLGRLQLGDLPRTAAFRAYASPPTPDSCAGCQHRNDCSGGSVERRWLWCGSLEHRDPLCAGPGADGAPMLPHLAQATPGSHWRGPTVHLDYLPTIVALPPELR